jgi:Uma2 family endonuclease
MRHDPLYEPITVDQFLSIDFGSDKKFELVDGMIRMMTGGTSAHARVSGNIYFFLRQKLAGSGCLPYNSDMGVRISDTNLRYPDVSVYCDHPTAEEKNTSKITLGSSNVRAESLSSDTSGVDQGTKLEEYRGLAAVDTIVFVDPENELARVFQRLGPTAWRDDMFAQPHDVELPALGIVLSHTEIFARD